MRLTGNNRFTGPIQLAGGIVISGDAALGGGGKLVFSEPVVSGGLSQSRVTLAGAWTTGRTVEFIRNGTVNTAGFDATWSGTVVGSANDTIRTLTKSGAGALTLTGTTGLTFNATATGDRSVLQLAGEMAIGAGAATLGGMLIVDNATTARSDRLGDTSALTLNRGRFELIGHPAQPVQEWIGPLTTTAATANAVTVRRSGAASIALAADAWAPGSGSQTVFTGLSIGGVEGAGGRVTFYQTPTLVRRALPGAVVDDLLDGAGYAFATHDPRFDADGPIGVRALRDAEHARGALIQNPSNGGATEEDANFLAEGAVTVEGVQARLNTLTLAGASVTLNPSQTLVLSSGSLLARRGPASTLAGGNLALPSSGAGFLGDGDLTITSGITMAGGTLLKLGTGTLELAGPLSTSGATWELHGGTVLLNDISGGSGGVRVLTGGTLAGSGRVGGTTRVFGTLAPGDGIGVLRTSALTLESGSTLRLEIGSPTLFDSLEATGVVTLTGDVRLQLSLAGSLDGALFAVLSNDGIEPVVRTSGAAFTYAGVRLEEGSEFTAQGQPFRLTYAGGDGNDVVLQGIPEPSAGLLTALGALGSLLFRRKRLAA